MTAPYRRTDPLDVLGNHERRIGILEAVLPPEEASGAQFDIKVFADFMTLSVGDGQFIFSIPSDMDGYSLSAVAAYVTTVSSSGIPTIQIRNVTAGVDMLTTSITIDVSEFTSYTAATPPVVNLGNATVATGDLISVDVDVAGTNAKGLGVILDFEP